MKISIRSKLILAISTLIVVLFSIASSLFINEKKRELADDIFVNTLAFSRLTAPSIAYFYDLYLIQNSFVYFNREIAEIFEQNDDVSVVEVVSYDAEGLYNSSYDVDKKEYHEIDFEGNYELTSLIGNITKKDGAPFVHAHITMSDHLCKAYGGHLFKATIAAAGEFFIKVTESLIDRKFDKNIGLYLWKFDHCEL